MRKLGFREIQTMECLLREFNIQTTNMPVANLGFDTFGETTPGSGPINNTNAGTREPQVGMVQKAWDSWRRKRPYQRDTRSKGDVKKRSKQDDQDEPEDGSVDDDEEEDFDMAEVEDENIRENKNEDEKCTKDNGNSKDDVKSNGNNQKFVYTCKSAAPKLVIPGHTGYLTFATLFPEFTR